MTTILYTEDTRGKADYGWLQANFSFSFGNYFNPDKMQFGMLRVLNDDIIAPGMGFGTHPHDNMEIITIPLQGGLRHRDSLGNEAVVKSGEVQVMSAGTGIQHSEMNASKTEKANTLQIWVLPEINNVVPRYDQKSYDLEKNKNEFVTVVAPHNTNFGDALWVYQQTYFSLGVFDKNHTENYKIKIPNNGVYLYLIDGKIEIDNKILNPKDAIGITKTDEFNITIIENSKILLIEVPM